jgi:hypothetical protein
MKVLMKYLLISLCVVGLSSLNQIHAEKEFVSDDLPPQHIIKG